MKRTILSLVAAAALCASSFLFAAPAMASGAPALNTPPYLAWGNDSLGDCPFAAIANLVRMHWPTAPMTTNAGEPVTFETATSEPVAFEPLSQATNG